MFAGMQWARPALDHPAPSPAGARPPGIRAETPHRLRRASGRDDESRTSLPVSEAMARALYLRTDDAKLPLRQRSRQIFHISCFWRVSCEKACNTTLFAKARLVHTTA